MTIEKAISGVVISALFVEGVVPPALKQDQDMPHTHQELYGFSMVKAPAFVSGTGPLNIFVTDVITFTDENNSETVTQTH